jgi:hypothetical protein
MGGRRDVGLDGGRHPGNSRRYQQAVQKIIQPSARLRSEQLTTVWIADVTPLNQPKGTTMAINPICGMTVDEATALHAERQTRGKVLLLLLVSSSRA